MSFSLPSFLSPLNVYDSNRYQLIRRLETVKHIKAFYIVSYLSPQTSATPIVLGQMEVLPEPGVEICNLWILQASCIQKDSPDLRSHCILNELDRKHIPRLDAHR